MVLTVDHSVYKSAELLEEPVVLAAASHTAGLEGVKAVVPS